MSDFKHTPGPWKVRNAREVFKGGRRVCSVNAAECLPIGLEMDRAAANAALIAASPDLLKALLPFIHFSSSEETVKVTLKTKDVEFARDVVARAMGDL